VKSILHAWSIGVLFLFLEEGMPGSNGHGKQAEVIFCYTQAQAIADGVLLVVGYYGKEKIVFARSLFYAGYADVQRRQALIARGLELLKQPEPGDSAYMKLRVIEPDKLWVIWSAGEGYVFMKPEDY
jgi:hypothetical protein